MSFFSRANRSGGPVPNGVGTGLGSSNGGATATVYTATATGIEPSGMSVNGFSSVVASSPNVDMSLKNNFTGKINGNNDNVSYEESLVVEEDASTVYMQHAGVSPTGPKTPVGRRPKEQRVVSLNIGGQIFDVSKSLLEKIPLFESMFSDRWAPELDANGRVFIERDGHVFRDVLNVLRYGEESLDLILGTDRGERLARLSMESEFYGLIDLPETIRSKEAEYERSKSIGKEIRFSKVCRVEGRKDERSSFWNWRWCKRSGDPCIFRPMTEKEKAQTSDRPNMKVEQSGTYLLILRLYTVCHEHLGNSVYTSEWNDEFVQVSVKNQNTVQFPTMDARGQTPIARGGAFDYRDLTEQERIARPEYVTATCMELVELNKGDQLSITYPDTPYEFSQTQRSHPGLPDDIPANLISSCTMIKLEGDTLCRYDRVGQEDGMVARWQESPTNIRSRLNSKLGSENSDIQVSADGVYLVFGRVALTSTRKEISIDDREGTTFGHAAQLIIRSPNQRVTYASNTSCLQHCQHIQHVEKVCELSSFADLVDMKRNSTITYETDGHVSFHRRGTADDKYCKLPTQGINLLLLPRATRVGRFLTIYDDSQEEIIGWEFSSPTTTGLAKLASTDDTAGIRINGDTDTEVFVLVLASIPPKISNRRSRSQRTIALVRNGEAEAVSITADGCGQWHHIRQAMKVKGGDVLRLMEVHSFQEAWRHRMFRPLSQFPDNYRGHCTIIELK